jgi:GNAT superfamily N-acetyltransferase
MIKIRRLLKSEIHLLQDFPPEDWKLDLPALLSFHFDQSYFYPIVAETENKIVGCGNAYCHGKIGWLGNIIVIPDYRKQGIGKALTNHLMEYLMRNGCKTQLLIATEMGENVYRSLGFKTCSTYTFYKQDPPFSTRELTGVRKAVPADIPDIKKLDKKISGEDRFTFIERFVLTAWVHETSGHIGGVYFPDFGNGLIIAEDKTAGLNLMKLRLSEGRTSAIIPSANETAKEFLLSENFLEYRAAPRMVFGNDIPWQPTMIYNRGSGYCG